MKQVTIERLNKSIEERTTQINEIVKMCGSDKSKCLGELTALFSGNMNLKFGSGGSHIWCSNMANERIFIVTGY